MVAEFLSKTIPYCQECELKHRGYALPRGEGKKYLILGEAPGEEEEKKKMVFIGRSGKMLDEWLEYLNIREYMIDNIVKHRPPDNATPTIDMVGKCKKYFEMELEMIKPQFLILVGHTATTILDEKGSMMQLIKLSLTTDLRYKDARVIIFFHPSYFLHKGIGETHPQLDSYLDLYKDVVGLGD